MSNRAVSPQAVRLVGTDTDRAWRSQGATITTSGPQQRGLESFSLSSLRRRLLLPAVVTRETIPSSVCQSVNLRRSARRIVSWCVTWRFCSPDMVLETPTVIFRT